MDLGGEKITGYKKGFVTRRVRSASGRLGGCKGRDQAFKRRDSKGDDSLDLSNDSALFGSLGCHLGIVLNAAQLGKRDHRYFGDRGGWRSRLCKTEIQLGGKGERRKRIRASRHEAFEQPAVRPARWPQISHPHKSQALLCGERRRDEGAPHEL